MIRVVRKNRLELVKRNKSYRFKLGGLGWMEFYWKSNFWWIYEGVEGMSKVVICGKNMFGSRNSNFLFLIIDV